MLDPNTAGKPWFSDALESCFGADLSIPYALFLKIFTGPMCIPWNRNYGKSPEQRKSGAAAGNQKRGPEDVYSLQLQLLGGYEARLESWQSDLPLIKHRLQDLSDTLVKYHIPLEEGYADKHHNHKAQNYLNFFLQARCKSEKHCQEMFRRTVRFYSRTLEKLFSGTGLVPQLRLEAMKTAFQAPLSGQKPRISAEESTTAQMGWYLAALLLLGAVQTKLSPDSNALAECLLGVTLLEEGRTVSVPTITRVTLQRSPFCALLGAALRAELELEEIQEFYRIFQYLRQQSDNQLDAELGMLLEQFLEAMDRFGQRCSEALATSWKNDQAMAQINEMKNIYKICREWLN